jgi:hypothetical protein
MMFLEVDPSIVRPGWTPLIITILLAAAIALLMISMRRQMRKIRVPYRDELEPRSGSGSQGTDAAPSADGEDGADDQKTDENAGSGTTGERRPAVNAE